MNESRSYTLKELADQCGLTERTTRYYIEQVLPPHHKKGRGKLARYGQDTLNSIRFIQLVKDRYRFRPGQAKDVLANVPQETIDRVVRGEEELAVATVSSGPDMMSSEQVTTLSRPSKRAERYKQKSRPRFGTAREPRVSAGISLERNMSMLDESADYEEMASMLSEQPPDPWHTVFVSKEVRIQCRNNSELSDHQQEQVEAAARLIELAIKK